MSKAARKIDFGTSGPPRASRNPAWTPRLGEPDAETSVDSLRRKEQAVGRPSDTAAQPQAPEIDPITGIFSLTKFRHSN
jgi:hypothetical protein